MLLDNSKVKKEKEEQGVVKEMKTVGINYMQNSDGAWSGDK